MYVWVCVNGNRYIPLLPAAEDFLPVLEAPVPFVIGLPQVLKPL